MQRIQGFAEQGDQKVLTAGQYSVNVVQGSFPGATITVWETGTVVLANIYADNLPAPTPLANPFTADDHGHWFFYAPNGRYDIRISGGGLPCPWTIGDVMAADPAGGGVAPPRSSPILIADDYEFSVTPGGVLAPGLNTLTLAAGILGLYGFNTTNFVYVSGGTGAAEAVPIMGGTYNPVTGGTLIINCANAHTGNWTLSSASGGIQEAVGAAPTDGAKILVSDNLTLYANVSANGKSLVLEKLPGAAIANNNLFSIFQILNVYGVTANDETLATNGVTVAGSSNTSNTQPPPLGQAFAAYRATSDAFPANTGRLGAYVQYDHLGATGTVTALQASLFTPNAVTAQGNCAIGGYAFLGLGGPGTTETIGVHGECRSYNPGSSTVSLNAEAAYLGTVSNVDTYLFGVVSNVGTTNTADCRMIGVEIRMNPNPISGQNVGDGINLHAVGGVHAYGVKIYDDGGTFTTPILVDSAQPNPINLALLNSMPGTATANCSIGFYRGGLTANDLLGIITATHAPNDFGQCSLIIGVSNNVAAPPVVVMTLDHTQVVTVARSVRTQPILVAALPPSAGSIGCWACVTDATSNAHGAAVVGGGANTVAVFCNPTGWVVVV